MALFAVLCFGWGGLRWWSDGGGPPYGTKIGKDLSAVKPECVVTDVGGLPQKVIDGVEKFLFFIGWPRSGHSIVAALTDAHPNLLIANAFSAHETIMKNSGERFTKAKLFNSLHDKSVFVATVGGLNDKKGYTLHMDRSCQGSFTELKVIGEKYGGKDAVMYGNSPLRFRKAHKELLEMLQMPVKVIQVVRNPYDMVSTHVLYSNFRFEWKDNSSLFSEVNKFRDLKALQNGIEYVFGIARNIQKMRKALHLTVLEVHNTDLIHHTRETLGRICQFLNVPCPEWYLDACDEKVYKKVSRSRVLVEWNPRMRVKVKVLMKRYSFFQRYTFDSD